MSVSDSARPTGTAAVRRVATCVAIGGRGLLIEGASGSGKSSLALALLDDGATLVGDDGVELSARHGRLVAEPVPSIAGKLEIRGVGLVDFPATSAPVALVLKLDREPPRWPGERVCETICGIAIPALPFAAFDMPMAARARQALAVHGLPLP